MAVVRNTTPTTIRLHALDDVVIATKQLVSGMFLVDENITVSGLIPAGHKLATRNLAIYEPVRRYGQIIGFASRKIQVGHHVHIHNLSMDDSSGSFERSAATLIHPAEYFRNAHTTPSTFLGIIRKNGKVATRNYIGILTSVNCSATVARAIADKFRKDIFPDALKDYPNIDGVVALTHSAGCAIDSEGEGLQVLRRTLAGYAQHPNFASVLVVGLGCETNQIPSWLSASGLSESSHLQTFNIQDAGGTAAAIQKGVQAISKMLDQANSVTRVALSAKHLVVGLQCGGSDSFSGITANPALGAAVDRLVAEGGTAILSETPEIYGAEHLLTNRAQTPQIATKLLDRIRWWQDYCEKMGASLNNNPSAGNKAGGLTTILEKSLGAVAKGGSSELVDVLEYAQTVTGNGGLVFMDTPGYDPVSATGQVAGGANVLCFTTGRGSAYGCAPTPSIKLATNSNLWRKQSQDIDVNCGGIVDHGVSIRAMGDAIFQLILSTASGQHTKSEVHGYGQNEFVPWQLGAIT
jgi:altronate hydrolase